MADAVAPKGANTTLKGTLIPSYSSVAYGLSNDGLDSGGYPNFSGGYGSTQWNNAIEIGGTANGTNNDTVYYSIYSDRASQGYGGTNYPVVWSVNANTAADDDILSLVNKLPEMNAAPAHSTFADAMNWLRTEGYFVANRNYPKIGFAGNDMAFAFDPTFMASYPWTGINLYDLVGNASQAGAFVDNVTANVDVTNGTTPYLTVSQTGTNGFIKLDDAVVTHLGNSYDYITASLWFKLPTSSIKGVLLHIQDASSAGTFWFALKYDNTSGPAFFSVTADPRSQGTSPGDVTISTGLLVEEEVFYCATIQMDLVNNNLKAWITPAAGPFNSTPIYDQSYVYAGGGSSVANNPKASALGAKIQKGFAAAQYVSDGINATFGSLHLYASNNPFTAAMANKIFDETAYIYA